MLIICGWGPKLIFSTWLHKSVYHPLLKLLLVSTFSTLNSVHRDIILSILPLGSQIYSSNPIQPRSYLFKYNLKIVFNVWSGEFLLGNHI